MKTHGILSEKRTALCLVMIAAEEDGVRFDVRSRCLSYYLGEQYTRQGYMKEALRAVLHELFTEEDLEVVAARVFTGNIASEKLLRSLGFVYEGCIRRCVRTSKAESATTCSFRYCGRNISRRKNNFTKKLDLECTLSCKI